MMKKITIDDKREAVEGYISLMDKVNTQEEEDIGKSDTEEEDANIENKEEVNHLTEFSPRSSFIFGAFFNPAYKKWMSNQENGEHIATYLEETDCTSMACLNKASCTFFAEKRNPASNNITTTMTTNNEL